MFPTLCVLLITTGYMGRLILQAVTVVFALILACVAATAALALFFRARQQWQESFWKRGVCSLFLAAAVCG